MSEDGFLDSFEEPNIEIQIKTLLGTTFDIKVSSNDTVGAIKKKIYRVEGIPVYHQNLIFQSKELKDTAKLCDSGIRDGSVLTLVSAMRGGPISTRRLSVTCEHYLLRELKELLENSRDDMTPGSKVSVLVFKEGDIINLLRVIENEDGSYSPYNDCPISPPTKPSRRDTLEAFERLVEDTEMCTKVATLKKKIEQMNLRKQNKNKGDGDWKHCTINDKDDKGKHMSYKFLEECTGEMLDSIDLPIFDRNIDEGNQSECEELALKDKHRTKPKTSQSLPIPKSLFNERKGSTYSHARHSYAKIAKRRDPRLFEDSERNSDGSVTFSRDRVLGAASSQTSSSSFNILNPYYSGASFSMLENGPAGMAPYPERNRKSGNKCSENPYLLQGLHSNKLPGLRILDTDDFLKEDLHPERILDGTLRRTPGSSSDNGFINSTPNCMGNNGATYLGAAQVPESNFVGLRDHDYSLARSNYNLTSKLSQTHSLDSSTYCHLSSSYLNNKLPQTNNYSLTSMNTLSQSSDSTLDASNLAQIESLGNMPNSRDESPILEATEGASVEDVGAKLAEQLHLLDEEPETDLYEVTARNRVHLTRLVLASEGTERPKSTPDSIELEEHTRDVWEIHEPPSERLKHSATCKVGLLKRRQGVEYNYDTLENSQSAIKPELSNYSNSSAEFGVYSGANTFYMPKYLSAPSAIPPQYAPKHHPKYCDLFFRNEPRSPLYSRKNRKDSLDVKDDPVRVEDVCSNIERLKNDENILGTREEFNNNYNESLFGYCNLVCTTDLLEKVDESKEILKLPPVIKKKSRCSECNKRLNITNIYNCRCGRIFCSQHRYSEVHKCTYDYKTEGRKILEHQNPLVTAEKVQRF